MNNDKGENNDISQDHEDQTEHAMMPDPVRKRITGDSNRKPANESQPGESEEGDTAVPFSVSEIARGFLLPFLNIEYFLGSRDRLAKSVAQQKNLLLIALLLLFNSLLFAIPYGVIGPIGEFWKIGILFTGPLVICFPSLIVFSSYLGFRLNLPQSLVITLIISCTAAMFSFGFAPIIWFIDYTTTAQSNSPRQISFIFTLISVILGIVHSNRCFFRGKESLRTSRFFKLLWWFWLLLLVFIYYRMAGLLSLLWIS